MISLLYNIHKITEPYGMPPLVIWKTLLSKILTLMTICEMFVELCL